MPIAASVLSLTTSSSSFCLSHQSIPWLIADLPFHFDIDIDPDPIEISLHVLLFVLQGISLYLGLTLFDPQFFLHHIS